MNSLTAPRPFLRAGVSLLARRTARRLANRSLPLASQQAALAGLVAAYSRCDYGRAHGIQSGTTYEAFRNSVPLATYEDFSPWIERMKRGESNLLWPGQCRHYAVSSGTTAGRTKFLPVTPEMLRHFRRTGLDSLLYYAARTGSSSVFSGKHLFLGGSTSLTPLEESRPFTAFGGDLSGITALNLPSWAEHYLYEPGREIAQLSDWPSKLQAICERVQGRNITLIAGIPSWILILAEQLRRNAGASGARNLRDLFPNLECLVHGGVPIAPYVDELREALGEGIRFHEVYPASEGFIATQDASAEDGLRLLTDSGLFFEFLPMNDFDEPNLPKLGNRAVPLEGVRAGVDYALVLSTPAGLCRYVIGDIVRFVTTEPPRLVYAGRTKLQLSAFGEHVIEKDLTDALAEVARQHATAVAHFHVAPVFVCAEKNIQRGRHEWFIETTAQSGAPAQVASFAQQLDFALQKRNDDYEAKRKGGGLDAPIINFVQPGVFEAWLKSRGKWGGQNKMPRCRSDRAIADELASFLK